MVLVNRFSRGSDDAAASGDNRGQLALAFGAAVVIALLTLLVVHAQLGFARVTETTEAPPPDDIVGMTEDVIELATVGVTGRYNWAKRGAVVADSRSRLNPAPMSVERAHSGGAVLTMSDSVASGWAFRNYPNGPPREFGLCVADDGVVVQERAGETTAVTVLVDVRIATPWPRTGLMVAAYPG